MATKKKAVKKAAKKAVKKAAKKAVKKAAKKAPAKKAAKKAPAKKAAKKAAKKKVKPTTPKLPMDLFSFCGRSGMPVPWIVRSSIAGLLHFRRPAPTPLHSVPSLLPRTP